MFGKKKSRKKSSRKKYPHSLLNDAKRQSRFAESYRTLRTNIHFSMVDRNLRSLVVTSTGQSEGKTVTAFNLALTMAQSGRSVLVVDGDLRKPVLSRLYPDAKPRADQPSKGLTGILADEFTIPIRNGDLADMSVPDLFQLLYLQKRTGHLALRSGEDAIVVALRRGKPVDVNWVTRPNEKRLANVLVRKRLLSPENAELALKRRKTSGQKLGFILTQMGFIPEAELRGPLALHLSEALHVLFAMQEGTYEFKDGSFRQNETTSSQPDGIGPIFDRFMEEAPALPYIARRIDTQILNTGIENLHLLPSGQIPPNPSELLSTDGMPFLIRMLSRTFELVIIDTPPVLPASDAMLLAPIVDGFLLVIKAGALRRNMITRCVEQLQGAKANLLGVILNDVNVHREGYYKYYHKYYSQYYSDAN